MSRRLVPAVLLALSATTAGAQTRLPVITDAPTAGVVDASFATTGANDLSLDGRAFTNAQPGVVDGLARETAERPALQLGDNPQPSHSARRSAAVSSRVSRLPEPATWAMMIIGFGLIGVVVRRGLRRSDERFNAYIRSITEDADT